MVTGDAGYIGFHTCVPLLKAGHEVAVIDNFQNSQAESLTRVLELTGASLEVHDSDVREPSSFKPFMHAWRPEAVIHFAGLKPVGEPVEKPGEYYTTNVQGTVNVARPELSVALLRYFNPVGAHPSGRLGEDPRGIPANLMPFMARVADGTYQQLKVLGDDYPTVDGTGIRDYVHVVDLADVHLASLDALVHQPGQLVWNVGRGEGVSVLQMVAAFERVTGADVPCEVTARRPGDAAMSSADVQRITAESTWRAQRGLDEMVADLWRWQQKNPHGYSVSRESA